MRPPAPVLLFAALLVAVAPAPALAGDGAAAHDVLDDHPPVTHDPAAALGVFPMHDDVQAALAKAAAHPWATLHDVGASESGRPVRVLEIADPNATVPRDERVVTLLLTQQHGNEPAGTGAAVELLEAFAAGEALHDGVLDNQVVLFLVQANPDGAEKSRRHNDRDLDINRDHVALESAEAEAIHEVLRRWDVHVAMDHHEYGGIGYGNPSPVRIYDADLTTLFPRHANVRAPTQDASNDLMYDAIWPAAQEAGYTVNEYGEVTLAGVPVDQVAGGPDPGILRNNFGLNHVAGLLIETRVDQHPNPFHDAQRRIDIHRVVMDATLAYASQNAQRFIDAKRASENQTLQAPAAWYEEGEARGAMPDGFTTRVDLDALFALHGMPQAVAQEDGTFVHDLRHGKQALAAAVLHPSSSRAVASATAVELPDSTGEPIAPASTDVQVPAAPAVLILAAAAGLALVLQRRP